MTTLKIAMLTHSVNPRGGVVHALQLAEALHDLGHDVTLIAPAEAGKDFYRPVRCKTVLIPLLAVAGDWVATVGQRIQAYADYFAHADLETYDIYHAQDAISGCAMANLKERGVINDFVRTVHHLDRFDDIWLTEWQNRSFQAAGRVLCVSRDWQERLLGDYGIAALPVNNGIDAARYTPTPGANDAALRLCLGLTRGGPLFLAVGGVEARKNTLRIFEAFLDVLKQRPEAQLIIVGGASLLDHGEYRQRFAAAVAASGIEDGPGQPLVMTGPLPDADMPALFRLADALVFPSLNEGFGLVVLEAIVSGTPAVVSARPPFTEYLKFDDCVWTDPEDSTSIAKAMMAAIEAFPKERLPAIARRLSDEYCWQHSARSHLTLYRSLINTGETVYA
ncbi:MSMEG_0565 family glycosyltransferase [Methylomonas sp. BW4-1]|uniref:MSMEG_0565 family glycosyltransferase n=1 Tax=Methylomonas sp. BW4-1 TaxID=3376685 RepID=UPI004041F0F5